MPSESIRGLIQLTKDLCLGHGRKTIKLSRALQIVDDAMHEKNFLPMGKNNNTKFTDSDFYCVNQTVKTFPLESRMASGSDLKIQTHVWVEKIGSSSLVQGCAISNEKVNASEDNNREQTAPTSVLALCKRVFVRVSGTTGKPLPFDDCDNQGLSNYLWKSPLSQLNLAKLDASDFENLKILKPNEFETYLPFPYSDSSQLPTSTPPITSARPSSTAPSTSTPISTPTSIPTSKSTSKSTSNLITASSPSTSKSTTIASSPSPSHLLHTSSLLPTETKITSITIEARHANRGGHIDHAELANICTTAASQVVNDDSSSSSGDNNSSGSSSSSNSSSSSSNNSSNNANIQFPLSNLSIMYLSPLQIGQRITLFTDGFRDNKEEGSIKKIQVHCKLDNTTVCKALFY